MAEKMNKQFPFQPLTEYFQGADEFWNRIAGQLNSTLAKLDDVSLSREKLVTKFILLWMR
jgi:hypothetical protein